MGPLRLALVGTAAICWRLWRRCAGFAPITMALSASLLAIFGHTPEAMQRNAAVTWRSIRNVVNVAFPNSRYGWGALLFAAAFLLLGLGAWATWRRHDREMPEQDQ